MSQRWMKTEVTLPYKVEVVEMSGLLCMDFDCVSGKRIKLSERSSGWLLIKVNDWLNNKARDGVDNGQR